MYVISGNKDESYAIYNDPNATDGSLMMGGMLSANDEITVDGKATYNNTEYYRIAHEEGSMLTIQLIIPAEYVTAEKVVKETQKPVEQQPAVEEPETTPEAPAYDPNSGISESDWNKLFGGGSSSSDGMTWDPHAGNSEFNSSVNEKGGLDITGGTLDPSEVGGLKFH